MKNKLNFIPKFVLILRCFLSYTGGKSNAIVLSNKFHGFPNIHFIDDPNFTIWNELICRESNGDEIASKFVQDFEIIMNERPKLTRSISTTSIISTN